MGTFPRNDYLDNGSTLIATWLTKTKSYTDTYEKKLGSRHIPTLTDGRTLPTPFAPTPLIKSKAL